MEASLSPELEEESMIIPHIRVYAWVWDVMRHYFLSWI